MSDARIALLVVIAFSALTVVADIFVKKAADARNMMSAWFVGGLLLYALSTFGWFHALKHMKLATLGGVYSISVVLMLTVSAIVFFGERPSLAEYGVILMALLSIIVLWRVL